MKGYFILFFGFFGALFAHGQQGVLEAYVAEGVQANLGLSQEQLRLRAQQLRVAEAKGKFLPTVSFEASYLLARGGRDIEIPVGSLVNPIYGALNELTGTNNFPVDLADVSEQLAPNNFHETRFRVTQPIFNQSIYYNRKAQESLVQVQEANIKVKEQEVAKEIRVAYFNYLKTLEVLRVLDSTELLLDELLRFNQKLVRYDKATRDVVSGVQFELSKLNGERAEVRQQSQVAKAYFNTLLNRDLNADVTVDADIIRRVNQMPGVAEARSKAVQQRPELTQIKQAIQANQILTELNKKSRLPTLGAELGTGFQGFGYKFDGDQFITTLGLAFNWTIYEGKQRDVRIQQAEVETLTRQKEEEMIRQQIELQVIQASYALQAATEKLVSEQAAATSAEDRFRIVRSKYENEQALLVDYLDARTKMTNANIAVTIARYDVLIRQAELRRAVGN